MKFRVIKLMDRVSFSKMSATNSFLSMISGVLFVSSQITRKSWYLVEPERRARMAQSVLKLCRVKRSFSSKRLNLAAVEIAFSRTMNNLRTLIRSNALGLAKGFYHQTTRFLVQAVKSQGLHLLDRVYLFQFYWIESKIHNILNLSTVETCRREPCFGFKVGSDCDTCNITIQWDISKDIIESIKLMAPTWVKNRVRRWDVQVTCGVVFSAPSDVAFVPFL